MLLNFFKTWWKHVITIAGVISIITTIILFDARYAKTEQQEKIETKVTETSDRVKTIDIKQNIMRVNSITEQMLKTRILMKTYPKDKEIKEDYKILQQEKINAQQELDKSLGINKEK